MVGRLLCQLRALRHRRSRPNGPTQSLQCRTGSRTLAEVETRRICSTFTRIVAIVGSNIAAPTPPERKRPVMRIRVVQRPSRESIDGLRLDRFQPGFRYDVGTTLGCLFLSEGWAEPVATEEPALLIPPSETKA